MQKYYLVDITSLFVGKEEFEKEEGSGVIKITFEDNGHESEKIQLERIMKKAFNSVLKDEVK